MADKGSNPFIANIATDTRVASSSPEGTTVKRRKHSGSVASKSSSFASSFRGFLGSQDQQHQHGDHHIHIPYVFHSFIYLVSFDLLSFLSV